MPRPAPFDYFSQIIAHALHDAWMEASEHWRENLLDAIRSGDQKRAREMAKRNQGLGPHAAAKARTAILAALLACQRKSADLWPKMLKKKFQKAPGTILSDPDRRDRLRQIKADQMEAFMERFPDRILDPEIERLIDLMPEYETATELDLEELAERAGRMLESEAYWESMSDVEVSRMWNGDGVALSKEQGIITMQIIAMIEDVENPPCSVCLVFHGNEVDVETADAKYNGEQPDDPEQYVEKWAFPRFNEVQLMTPEELTDSGDVPPFHGGG